MTRLTCACPEPFALVRVAHNSAFSLESADEDFNDQPHSATYHLLTGQPINQHCLDELKASSVVHQSIDIRVNAERARAKGDAQEQKKAATAAAAGSSEAQSKDASAISAADTPSNATTASGGEKTEAGEEGEEEDEMPEGDPEGEEGDDQILKNCRVAQPSDGLLSIEELQYLYHPTPSSSSPGAGTSSTTAKTSLLSTYAAYNTDTGNFFGTPGRGRERYDDESWTPNTPNPHEGPSREPMWTIFSSLFSLTLDYIFLLPSPSPLPSRSHSASEDAGEKEEEAQAEKRERHAGVTALLETHRTDVLQPGVPRKGVCASDHIAIGAEICL